MVNVDLLFRPFCGICLYSLSSWFLLSLYMRNFMIENVSTSPENLADFQIHRRLSTVPWLFAGHGLNAHGVSGIMVLTCLRSNCYDPRSN